MRHQSPTGPLLHLFDFDRFPPSVERLGSLLTINSIAVSPSLRYSGAHATASAWTPWGYGPFMGIQGAGDAVNILQGSPLLGTLDNSVKFNGGGAIGDNDQYYKSLNTTDGNVGTEDLVLEFVLRIPTTGAGSADMLFSKMDATPIGWNTRVNVTDNALYLYLYVGGAPGYTGVNSSALPVGVWLHAMCFVNRDEASINGAQWYVNGILHNTGVDVTARSASVSNSDYFVIGAARNGTYCSKENIAYFAMWKYASWHPAGVAGPAAWATVAANRFAQLTGIYPAQSRGTAIPTTKARASVGYVDKYEPDGYGARKLYQVGGQWLRTCDRQNAAGTARIKGMLIEQTAINLTEYSETFGSWGPVNCSATVDGAVAPNGTQTADAMNSGVVTAEHYMQDVNGAATGATKYTGSVWLKQKDGYGWSL